MRVDVRSPRQLAFAVALIAVLAAVGAGLIGWSGWAGRHAAMALENDGVTLTTEVVDMTASNRGGSPVGVEVRLPDGRTTDVDVSERASNDGLKVGSKLAVVVQRDDIANNRPADVPAADQAWYLDALAPLGISIAGAVLSLVVMHIAPKNVNGATRG